MVVWASDMAEQALAYFEEACPDDDRPRMAIESARAWVRGDMKTGEVRKIALASHAAARNTENKAAKYAARAAGHAAATAHVIGHAHHAGAYAAKAANAAQRLST